MRKFYLLSVSIVAMTVAMPALAAGTKTTAPASSPTTASDYGFFFKPYVGADYQYSHFGSKTDSATGLKTSDFVDLGLNGGNVHIGARVHKNLGFELGYQQTEDSKKNDILGSGLNAKVHYSSETFDVLGYWPVTEKVDLIGTAGVSNSHIKASYTGILNETDKDSEIKPRIGVGAQYAITDNLNMRGIVRYQEASFGSSVDNAVVGNVGLNWQF